MEHGQLFIEEEVLTMFVFEDLIAHLDHPRMERLALKGRRFEAAIAQWSFDVRALDHVSRLINHYQQPVEVITWHPHEFGVLIHERLWDMDVQVRDVRSGDYSSLSPWIATDPTISCVYDADPTHRFGYGFKAREFVAGQF